MRLPFAAALLFTGCAYLGDPLPPSLKIPEAVSDVRAIQKGGRILVEFKPPLITTDGLPLGDAAQSTVLIGEAGSDPTNEGSKSIDATPWIGKEAVVGVRTRGPSGRWSAWSNFVTLRIREPLADAADLRAESAPEGIALTWRSSASRHRIYRDGELLAHSGEPRYLDATAELGKKYEYGIEAVDGTAESAGRPTVSVTLEDRFPPDTPRGLTALAGIASVELAWDAIEAADLARYRVYRNGEPSGDAAAAAYSDKAAERGVRYRYAVSAIDRTGNESARSAEVEVTLP